MKLALLNTSILTSFGVFDYRQITLIQAQQFVKNNDITSAIGHSSTAEILTKLLKIDVKVNRIQFEQDDET